MITQDEAGRLPGIEAYDESGERIGPVNQVYVDPHSGEPQWVTVRTGTLGFQESFVPLRGARLDADRLRLAVGGDLVRQAPLLDPEAPLEIDQADRLNDHYGLGGPTDTSADGAMTRSEERLVTGTRPEPVEKVRLRKYLVTEERQVTVPVTREEVRLERVPATEDDTAGDLGGGDAGEPGPDVILHAEEPVVTTRSVPVERVRLSKETVHDEETITKPVRREKIEYEGPDPDPAR
jgi:uncharacterized protein (TIGR02271 family)